MNTNDICPLSCVLAEKSFSERNLLRNIVSGFSTETRERKGKMEGARRKCTGVWLSLLGELDLNLRKHVKAS